MIIMAPVVDKQTIYMEDWQNYSQEEIWRILNRNETMMNAALFHPSERAVVGAFSIPRRKRKRFKSVTEIHYHNGCNELAMLLCGILAENEDPKVSRYITPEEFISARDEYRFHKRGIKRLKFRRQHNPDEYFTISLRLLRVKKLNDIVDVQLQVYDTVTGNLNYFYGLKNKANF